MNQSKIFNDGASIMSSQRLALKVTANDITKRLREAPETFEALKTQVKAQLSAIKGLDRDVKAGHFRLTYQDEIGDIIDIASDDDLLAAYDVAENFLNRQLKLKVEKADPEEVDAQPE